MKTRDYNLDNFINNVKVFTAQMETIKFENFDKIKY